jgi:hypothetical protein
MTEGVASEEDSKTTEQQELLKNGSVRDIVFYHVKHMLGYRWPEAEARIFSVEGFETRELTPSDVFPVIGERHHTHKNYIEMGRNRGKCPIWEVCNEQLKARTNYAEIYLRSAASEIRHDCTEWILDDFRASELEKHAKYWMRYIAETESEPHYSLEDLKEISLPYYLLGERFQCCDSEPREPHDQSPFGFQGLIYAQHRTGREDSLGRIPLFEERMTNPENERVKETFRTYLEVTNLGLRTWKPETFDRKVWEAFLTNTDPMDLEYDRTWRNPWCFARGQLGEEETEAFRKKSLLKSKNPEYIFFYCGRTLDAPWPEAEGILKGTDFWDAYNYYFYYGPDYDFWNKPWFGLKRDGFFGEIEGYHIIPNPRDFRTVVGKKWVTILPRWHGAKKPEPKTAKTYSGPRAQRRGKRGRRQHR